MTPGEEYFLKVRNKLDDLGYLQPLSFESVMLVDKLLEDFLETKKNLQHYKNVAQQSMEACSELQVGVGPYREDNAKLIKENNELRQKLLKARESIEDTKAELRREIRKLEKERMLQDYLCTQHASKISHLQAELAQKAAKLMECRGGKTKLHAPDPYRKKDSSKVDKDQMLEKAQEKINNLTREITKLKSEQQELDEVIEGLKNKVNARDSEIERLNNLLSDGRPLMSRNQCPCCSPQLLDCRLLAKNKELSEQLEESKQKQHEAMVRAVELAERNQLLENVRLPSARSGSESSKKCCCAENSNKICKLQVKLEERILQVEKLELELGELRKAHAELRSDKLSVDKILEITLEDKKKMNDRVNELAIIEHDLMLEIERLKRTNASQKSQLAEMEAQIREFEQKTQTANLGNRAKERAVFAKHTYGTSKQQESKKITQTSQKRVTISKPTSLPPKACKPPPPKKSNVRAPETGTDSSTLSSGGPRKAPPPRPSSPSSSPSPPLDLRDQLARERQQFQKQLADMEKQQAEHCAKFHPPPCPRSSRGEPSKEEDGQWLLLERVQAERDYYHKEFSRLRDQLCNIPDHSAEASSGPSSPHQKLERLLSERDYYHKEMCRLLDVATKSQTSQSALHEMEQKLVAKEDEVNVLQGKVASLQHKLAQQVPDMNSEFLKKISAKEEDIQGLSFKIRELESQISTNSAKANEELKRKLNMKEEEILNLRERLKNLEKTQSYHDQHQQVSELWRKLNLKEEEILTLREKIRDLERNQMPMDFALTNAELWRKLHLKEDELSRMQDKIRSLEHHQSEYSMLKRKYNEKEEENLCLREQIREYECNRCNSTGISQAQVTRLEMERDAAKGDCVRLREENNALREDMKRLKELQHCEEVRLEQAKKDFDNCVAQFEVERRGLTTEVSRLSEELKQCKDRARDLQTEATEQRTRCNHFKMVNEQTERELRTTQDLLHQTEAELASALDRVQELNDDLHKLDWELKEARQEKNCLKSNLTRLDQEKDALLLKLDEKTEHSVRLEGELESRDRRIASLEAFVADLQKKLDVALDTAARSEQSTRQHTLESDRLRKELDKMERCRDNAVREISRLQDDLASLTADHAQISRSLEAARREVEDLKLQAHGYVAEVRRITNILEEKEAERTAMLEHFRTLTVESANLESNNHSLESEARSTKGCLREAQTRIQDLEATLEEKKALVQGYEKQIRELTQEVAKLERKLNSQSRAESATRDLSRELETQKHCLAQQVDQLTSENKRLEDEVCGLREDLAHLQEQLGKERKNSSTLEKVLASSRQETLQRTKDNSELQAQVHCLQGKLRDLQDKLEHGSEALRRCQTECEDYQAQVTQLKREVTNERFQRARNEESRKSRSVVREKTRVRPTRSHSLTCLRALTMSPSYVCPCCFLNRISILRESGGSGEHLEIRFNHVEGPGKVSSEAQNVASYSSLSGQIELSEDYSQEVMMPQSLEDMLEQLKSSATFACSVSDHNMRSMTEKNLISDSTLGSSNKTEQLAEQIEYVLREQKKFLKEFNVDFPMQEDELSWLMGDQDSELQNWNGDSCNWSGEKNKNSKPEVAKHLRKENFTDSFYAGGDKVCVTTTESTSTVISSGEISLEDNSALTINKPTIYFNEEPVKLPKPFQCTLATTDSNLNKDYGMDKNISVKLLFFPEVELKGSSTSIFSEDCKSSVSVYVTAANSVAEEVSTLYTLADSCSDTRLQTTHSSQFSG